MRRKTGEIISRMATIAVLSALGTVLMLFVKFPYPPAPWCELEFSDTVILISYALYGFWGSLAVAVIKTLFSLMFQPAGFLWVGQIAAFIASLTYILGIYLCSHVFKWFKNGIVYRILSYVLISVLVSLVMTLMNYIFITPTYLAGRWASAFDSEVIQSIVSNDMLKGYGTTYAAIIAVVYLPFNLLKGAMVTAIYGLLFNRLIFILLAKSPKAEKYFLGPVLSSKKKEDKKPESDGDSPSYLDKISTSEVEKKKP